MKQRIYTFLIAFFVGISLCAQTSGTCGTNLTWSLQDSVLIISGTGKMYDYNYNGAPWPADSIASVIINSGVTGIGNNAFANCSNLTSITLPNSVISIGNSAFTYCRKLPSINIPSSVKIIGTYAFYDCTGIQRVDITDLAAWCDIYFLNSSSNPLGDHLYLNGTEVINLTIPSGKSVGCYTFAGCSGLKSVSIPDGVTYIEDGAFIGCSGLESVSIPDGVTYIGDGVFSGCFNLTSVNIPSSVSGIGSEAFRNCFSLPSVNIPSSVSSMGNRAFSLVANIEYLGAATGAPWEARTMNGFVEGNLVYTDVTKTNLSACFASAEGSISIPNSVTIINKVAFYECKRLTAIFIPNSVTKIGSSAFSGCSSLSSIIIPNSVTEIGVFAFDNCKSLSYINIPNSVTKIGEHAFRFCDNLDSVTIGTGVTNMGYAPFAGCESLKKVNINSNALVSKDYNRTGNRNAGMCFIFGRQVEEYIIGEGVTCIGFRAFGDSTSLVSVSIPNSVTEIKRCAFLYCSNLKSVTIPNRVTKIGGSAFGWCNGLDSVICMAETPPTMGGNEVVFGNVNCSSIPLYVPAQSVAAYRAAAQWKEFHPILAIGATFATYTITFKNWDGTELLKLTDVAEGTVPVYSGETPSRPDDDGFSYSFKEWTPQIVPATADVTYTATYEATPLNDSLEDVYADPSGTKNSKIIQNGHLYILLPDGTRYDATGRKIQ